MLRPCRALLIAVDGSAIKIPSPTTLSYRAISKPCVRPDNITLFQLKVSRKLDFIEKKKVGNRFCVFILGEKKKRENKQVKHNISL